MNPELSNGILTKIEYIAAHGLGPNADIVSPVDIPDADADLLLDAIEEHRLAGAAVVALIDGAIDASQEIAERIVAFHDEAMGSTMRVEAMAVGVSDWLTEAGIDHRLLGGPMLAHTVYSDPAARSFDSVSVIVPSVVLDDSVDLLTVQGARRLEDELRPGFDRRFATSVPLMLDDVEIHLHRVLNRGPFGVWMKPDDLFVLRSVLGIAGVDIPTLDATDALLHACYELALGRPEPRLSDVRDVALLAGSAERIGFDAVRFDQSVDRWRGRGVVRRAVRVVERRLGYTLPEELTWYGRVSVDRDEIEAIEPYLITRDVSRFGAMAAATLSVLPMSDRPAYARAIGMPDGAEPIDRMKSLLKRRQ